MYFRSLVSRHINFEMSFKHTVRDAVCAVEHQSQGCWENIYIYIYIIYWCIIVVELVFKATGLDMIT